MDEKGLGKRIQHYRLAAGLTQQQLCLKANLSFSTLTKIERGAIKSPSIFTITSIAQALSLSLDQLTGNETTAKKTIDHNNGLKFIYFDVNGTLVNFYHKAFLAISEDHHISIDAIEMAFLHVNDLGCKGLLTIEQINQEIADRLALKQFDWPHYYLSYVKTMPGMAEVVRWAAKNYHVGLISNTMPGLLPGLIQRGIVPNINYDVIIDSSEVKLTKPDPKIFDLALTRSGYLPNQVLLIDDNSSNVTIAEKVGWRVFWFDFYDAKETSLMLRKLLEMPES